MSLLTCLNDNKKDLRLHLRCGSICFFFLRDNVWRYLQIPASKLVQKLEEKGKDAAIDGIAGDRYHPDR